jgi:CcmD family protein
MNFDEMNRSFLIAAYAVMWTVVLGYTVRLVRKGSRVRRDHDRVTGNGGGGT